MQFETFALGTTVTVTYPQHHESKNKEIEKGITDILYYVSHDLSGYVPDSTVSKLNRERLVVANELFEYAVKKAIIISALSDGAFDITSQPLVDLWRKADEMNSTPDSQSIADIQKQVDYRHITVTGSIIGFDKKGVEINLDDLAKGYAADLIAKFFKGKMVYPAKVAMGGTVLVIGSEPKNIGWKVLITGANNTYHPLILNIKNKAVVSLGDYSGIVLSQRASHLPDSSPVIDPRNGYPVQDVPRFVSVVSEKAIVASGLARALFVLGPERGINLIDSLDDSAALIIDSRGKINYSKRWHYGKIKGN